MRVGFLLCLALAFFSAVQKVNCDDLDDYFSLLDKNKDGKISRTEAKIWGWPEIQFKWKDLNDDGFVDLKEFRTWLTSKKTRERMLHLTEAEFRAMDTNHDGKISYKEECWCSEDLFIRMDANHDGFLSRAEAFGKIQSLYYVKPKNFHLKKR